MKQVVKSAEVPTFTEIEGWVTARGFTLLYTNPTVRGEPQHCYTVRDAKSGRFVAWFCWYVMPATDRPNFARPRQEYQVSQVVADGYPPTDTQLLTEVLTALAQQHPVATT